MSNLTPNNDTLLQNPYPDDEIDLKELFMVLWSGKWIISAVTSFAAAISVVLALSLPNIYTASALLAPADSGGGGGLSGLMKQYGSLASLAGVSLPAGEDDSRTELGLHLIKSRSFIGGFVERRGILPELMAAQSWDAITGSVIFDSSLYDVTSKTWVREVSPPTLPEPSAQEAHKAFLQLLGVSKSKLTGYVTISIDHVSPIVAAQWVEWLVEDVNTAIKAQDVAEAEKSIEYLKQQAANTPLADLQSMFFELIQSQTETMMLAEVRPEYVFKTIDPAVIPEEKSKPGRALLCILGALFGGILGVLLVLIRHYINKSPI